MKGFLNKIKSKFQHLNHLHIESEIDNKDYGVKQILLLRDGRLLVLFEFVASIYNRSEYYCEMTFTPHRKEAKNIIQLTDSRIVSCSEDEIIIWTLKNQSYDKNIVKETSIIPEMKNIYKIVSTAFNALIVLVDNTLLIYNSESPYGIINIIDIYEAADSIFYCNKWNFVLIHSEDIISFYSIQTSQLVTSIIIKTELPDNYKLSVSTLYTDRLYIKTINSISYFDIRTGVYKILISDNKLGTVSSIKELNIGYYLITNIKGAIFLIDKKTSTIIYKTIFSNKNLFKIYSIVQLDKEYVALSAQKGKIQIRKI